MTHPDPAELSAVPLFAGLSAEQLAELSTQFEVNEYLPGQSPVRSGDHGYAFFVLADGAARVEVDGQVVDHLVPGSVFGEMAFFASNSRRAATIVPDSPIRVFTLFGADFRTMSAQYPEVAHRLEQLYTEHLARDQALMGEEV